MIGLIGGMSWESTALYYRLLNRMMIEHFGSDRNARSVVVTVQYEELVRFARDGRWDLVANVLADAVNRSVAAGAEIVALTSVTGHRVADEVEKLTGRKLLHIAEAAGREIRRLGWEKYGVLATRTTAGSGFLQRRLHEEFGLSDVRGDDGKVSAVADLIQSELTKGVFSDAGRRSVEDAADSLMKNGAQGVLLACTELPLLFSARQPAFPCIDIVKTHVDAIVAAASG
jgi:aspartate racemase